MTSGRVVDLLFLVMGRVLPGGGTQLFLVPCRSFCLMPLPLFPRWVSPDTEVAVVRWAVASPAIGSNSGT